MANSLQVTESFSCNSASRYGSSSADPASATHLETMRQSSKAAVRRSRTRFCHQRLQRCNCSGCYRPFVGEVSTDCKRTPEHDGRLRRAGCGTSRDDSGLCVVGHIERAVATDQAFGGAGPSHTYRPGGRKPDRDEPDGSDRSQRGADASNPGGSTPATAATPET